MNPLIYQEEQAISEFTLALLEDFGYYKAKYYTGGLMRYGKNKGCNFLEKKCVNDEQTNPLFENEFFNLNEIEPSCSSGRQSRTYNLIYYYTNIEKEYIYYENKNWGGWEPADYCPVAQYYEAETVDRYYVGHCLKGHGDYGSQIEYNSSYFKYSSATMKKYTGETYSNHSFCILSSLIKENTKNVELYSKTLRADCYEMFCSLRSLTIKIFNDYIVCPRGGGKITVEGYKGYFLCPDYNLICSGTVLCNDLFECIDKKSEIKETSYEYDYEIKTSQNIDRAEDEDFDNENNYELSDDGICPQYCSRCLKNQVCSVCKSEFALVGSKGEKKVICKPENELTIGYYKDSNSIYYKCIDNCDNCLNGESCEKCQEGFIYLNKTCKIKIDNCIEYNLDGTCKKCDQYFAFKENERNYCTNISEFENYYTKDDGISYHLCDGEGEEHIKNCKKCKFNKINLECNECKEDFFILDDELDKCYQRDDEKNYYFLNDTHAKTCSKAIENCEKCENESKCIKCYDYFFLLNNETDKCYNISEITSIDEYFLNEDNTTYLSCNNSLYHSIENCKKCTAKDNCLKCQEGFTFVDGNKSECINISLLGDKYYPDPDDDTNYKSCSEIDKDCLTCEPLGMCTSCDKGLGVFKDKRKCVDISNNDYYKNENDNLYYSCNETLGCIKCESKDICLLCDENEYGLLDNECKNKSELDDKYYQDKNTSEYKLCKEGVEN